MTKLPGQPQARPPEMAKQEDDPRRALAAKRLAAAHAELAAKEAESRGRHRRRSPRDDHQPLRWSDLTPSVSASVFVHGILLTLAMTFATAALVFCYQMLDMVFLAGRAIALPVGVIVLATLAYLSACFLGVIETTSHGHATLEDQLDSDWREWFWTLPATAGVAAACVFAAWGMSLLAPAEDRWAIVTVASLVMYPVLQLATLETGSPVQPFSPPVFGSMLKAPHVWSAVILLTSLLGLGVAWTARQAWRDPPYTTVLIVAPLTTWALLLYAWMLGQLARFISFGQE